MTIIISTDTVISADTRFSEPVQVAAGVTLTIMAGATLDLSGNTLLLGGNLKLVGNDTSFAGLSNGKISTENTAGKIDGSFAKIVNIEIEDFFSQGSINLTSSVFDRSSVEVLETTNFNSVLFRNTQVDAAGTNNANITKSTFVDSKLEVMAWQGAFSGSLRLTDVNFIGAGEVIKLDPFFNGSGFYHPVTIVNSYIANVDPSKVDTKIFDADDDIRVSTDIKPSSFKTTPYSNSTKGFVVGSEMVAWAQLGQTSPNTPSLPTISFIQETTAEGQIAVKLNSSDLPQGTFTFSLNFNYTGKNVNFSTVSYSGAAGTSTSASHAGDSGNVTISGTLSPSTSGSTFATILFDAGGTGVFDANVIGFKINGATPVFTDPMAYAFAIKGEVVDVPAGSALFGTYKPFTSSLGLTYGVKSHPQHGTVVFGQNNNPKEWKYTPTAGFYGVDSFVLTVSDFFDTKEKSISIHVSPVGTSGNDKFQSSAANYKVDGGLGIDVLQYSGKMENFTVAKSGSLVTVTDKLGAEGTNQLTNFERLMFSDGAIALDIEGNGGQAYRLYQAAFNRVPDAQGLGFWLSVLDNGSSLESVARGFMNSSEFKNVYGGAPTSTQLISQFYQNILHRAPEKAGLDYWISVLDGKHATSAQVLAAISESAENQAGVIDIIGNGFAYIPFG